jgi:hypothetical protein
MPTISQLPPAASVTPADAVPVSQGGAAKAVLLGTLLSGMQPAILVEQGSLLGRTSLGPGGPEAVTVGDGLVLHEGTLSAVGSGATQSAAFSVANLPRANGLSANDLVAVSHAGTTSAVTYSALLNGQTIDQAQPAAGVSGSDTLWVAQQGNTMVRQSFDAIWNWLAAKLPSARTPVVELSADTTLDGTVHNGRLLVCTQPLVLSSAFNNMGSGFSCEVINLSSGAVTFGTGITPTSGGTQLTQNQSASIRALASSKGNFVFAVTGTGSVGQALPGTVGALTVSNITANSATVSWTPPSSGGSVDCYTIRLRTTGSNTWSIVADNVVHTNFPLSGLTGGTSYDVAVSAVNTTGAGTMAILSPVSTLAAGQPPGPVVNLAAVTQGTDSVLVSWSAPTSGGTVTSYVVQFRLSGATIWTDVPPSVTTTSKLVTSLASATSYEFRVYAVGDGGTGASVGTVSATTLAPTGAVSSIVWNLTPTGPYTKGVGSIGVNVLVTPATAMVRIGFSTSSTMKPSSWITATYVNTNLWGAYIPTPSTAGAWYAWAEGTDGSASTVLATPFTVA